MFLSVLVTACGQVPQPFRPAGEKTAAVARAPGPTIALVVLPLQGIDTGPLDALTNRVVIELQKAEIAATVADIPNRYRLAGNVRRLRGDGADTTLAFRWTLLDPTGAATDGLDHVERLVTEDWLTARPIAIHTLAVTAAAHLVRLVNGDLPVAEAVQPPARISLAGIAGAPGDGNRALDTAIRTALSKQGLTLGPVSGATRATLELHVVVAASDKTSDRVTLLWLVRDATGRERGRLEQQNTVPAGRLSRRWGEIADLAAGAAAPDLARILEALAAEGG
ncbi:MAG: hypothetical protein P1U37_02570 [Minwuia sp.]|nr:hypothetical protein [Minwuia sp.]